MAAAPGVITSAEPKRCARLAAGALLLVALGLSLVLLYSGIEKMDNLKAFKRVVMSHGLLSGSIASFAAVGLAIVELSVGGLGLALILGRGQRAVALVLLAHAAVFLVFCWLCRCTHGQASTRAYFVRLRPVCIGRGELGRDPDAQRDSGLAACGRGVVLREAIRTWERSAKRVGPTGARIRRWQVGADVVSTVQGRLDDACRGACWPRKKHANTMTAEPQYAMAA